ncbi:MAG: ribonuclease Z [Ignavibacteria bacterium]
MKKYIPKYPLIWQKDDFFIKIFTSIPNLATGILLTTKNDKFVIDPGDGILGYLTKEIGPKKILDINDVFISHGHHDHVGGLWSYLTYLSVMKKKKPLNIYYPKGCLEIISIHNAFQQVYSHELTYQIKLIEIDEPVTLMCNSLKIEPFKVKHSEVNNEGKIEYIPSLGFKFIYDGKSICYGGDTAYCETLVEKSKDADLAIIEAGAEDEEETDLHMTQEQAIQIGETAKEYFLVHVPE